MRSGLELDAERNRFELFKILAGIFCIICGIISLLQNPVLSIGLIIAGIAQLLDKHWAPVLGIICSTCISILTVITLTVTSLYLRTLISNYILENIFELLIYFLIVILLLNLSNIMILLTFRNRSQEYWNKYYSSLKIDKKLLKEAYGVCPRCKCSEVKFVDGVKYKCAKCGFIY